MVLHSSFTFHSVFIPETAAFIHEWFHSGTTRWTGGAGGGRAASGGGCAGGGGAASGGGYGGGKGSKPGGGDVDDDDVDGKALKIASSKHLKGATWFTNRVNVT